MSRDSISRQTSRQTSRQVDVAGGPPGGSSEATEKTRPDSGLPRMVAPGKPIPPARCALVPEGGVFEGQVALVGETRIDGWVRGRLRGEGRLLLGPRGRIEGVLECDEIDSEGVVQGPIHARERLRLGPAARLDGDVETPRMEVCPSAVWSGSARVGSPRSREARRLPTLPPDASDEAPSG